MTRTAPRRCPLFVQMRPIAQQMQATIKLAKHRRLSSAYVCGSRIATLRTGALQVSVARKLFTRSVADAYRR
jgi:hypothetical protein